MKTLVASVFAMIAAGAAQADQITLSNALDGASLHAGAVDMAVYFTEADAGYEVVATYTRGNATEEPRRLMMLLDEGDAVSFGLPGQRGVVYNFARAASDVTVTATRLGVDLAQN